MEQQNYPPRRNPRPNQGPVILLAAAVLGICLIISASIVGGAVKKLTAAVTEQKFDSELISPSTITVISSTPKNYMTEKEAAAYLNVTEDEIKAAVSKGEIDEYIKTSSGYSIAKGELDEYFEQRAYDTLRANNESSDD